MSAPTQSFRCEKRHACKQTSKGEVQGTERNGVIHFGGIPFAAPPLGSLRWHKPQPASAWDGTLDCTEERKERRGDPVQKLDEDDKENWRCEEDCLYGHVWSPCDAHSAPVLVYIYGGSLIEGTANDPSYWGYTYAERGIVFCIFNYRVGALGFLWHPNGCANCGFWDQVMALNWVKDEIAAFGGNPDNVTIMGQSSGGDSVLYHLCSPASKGLFQRGIIQSPSGFASTPAQAKELAGEFIARLGVDPTDFETLQSISVEKIINVQESCGFRLSHACYPGWRIRGDVLPPGEPIPDISPAGILRLPVPETSATTASNDEDTKLWPGGHWPYPTPVIDGEFLTEMPLDALFNGAAASFEVVVGSNRDESAENEGTYSHEDLIKRFCWELAGAPALLRASPDHLRARVEALMACYEAERLIDPWGLGPTGNASSSELWLKDTISSDFGHNAMVELITSRLSKPGRSKCVYRYQFNGYGGAGNAYHSSEMELIIGELSEDSQGSPNVRDQWLNAWVAFVTSGNPNTDEMAGAWQPYGGKGHTVLMWDGVEGWRVGAEELDNRLGLKATADLWEELWNLERDIS